MVRFTPGFGCFVVLCAVTACFPGVVLEVDARAVPTRHEAVVKATPIPLPHKASSQSYKDPTYTVDAAGATAVLSPPKAHHSARPSGEHGKHGSSHEKPKEPKHEDGSEENTKNTKTPHQGDIDDNTWDLLDPLLQIGGISLGDGRDSTYSDTHHILKRLSPGIPAKREPHSHHDHDHDHDHNHNHDHDHDHDHDHKKREPEHIHRHGHEHIHAHVHEHVHEHKRRLPEDQSVFEIPPRMHKARRSVVAPRIGVVVPNKNHFGHDILVADAQKQGEVQLIHLRETKPSSESKIEEQGSEDTAPMKRETAAPSGVLGSVDIVTLDPDMSSIGERIASLVLSVSNNGTVNASVPKSAMSELVTGSGSGAQRAFVLDASNSTKTSIYLVAYGGSSTSGNSTSSWNSTNETDMSQNVLVSLQVPIFEPSEATTKQYCVTFDPNPPVPAALTMQSCKEELATPTTNLSMHSSQAFVYDPQTGVVKPAWTSDSGSSTGNDQQTFNSNQLQADVTLASSSSTSTMSSSSYDTTGTSSAVMPEATESNGTMDAARRNVTLVFTPAIPAVNVVEGGTASMDGSAAGFGMTNDQSTMLPSSLSMSSTTSPSQSSATVSPSDSSVASTTASSSSMVTTTSSVV